MMAAPEAPMGCPRAVAPPCTFNLPHTIGLVLDSVIEGGLMTLQLACAFLPFGYNNTELVPKLNGVITKYYFSKCVIQCGQQEQ